MNKSSDSKSIFYKIFNLLKKETLKQLADLFNLSLSSGVFPSLHKITRVLSVLKKDSKWDYCNLLSNIEKILEMLMYKRVYQYLAENNVIYDLQCGFRQKMFYW